MAGPNMTDVEARHHGLSKSRSVANRPRHFSTKGLISAESARAIDAAAHVSRGTGLLRVPP